MSRPWWQRARVAERSSTHVGPRLIRPEGRAIAGRVYYVWDEDPRTAAEWARELGESEPPVVTSTPEGEAAD